MFVDQISLWFNQNYCSIQIQKTFNNIILFYGINEWKYLDENSFISSTGDLVVQLL